MKWDAGAWFGSQLGGSCWMAVGASVLLARDAGRAAVVLALFVAANAVGLGLWRARAKVRALVGYQVLILTLGLASLLATMTIHFAGLWDAVQVGGRVPPVAMYCLLGALIPGLLIRMSFVERRAQAESD